MDQISARRATLLTMALFLVQPIHLGHWLSRIAEVQATLDLSKSQLAVALLGFPCGLLPALFFAGKLVDRIGPRPSLALAFPPMLLSGLLPGQATDAQLLFAALFFFGSTIAFTEVSLNVFAARAEKTFRIRIMNRAHGFWSLGVVLGSLIGIQFANAGMAAGPALIYSAIALLPVVMGVAFALPPTKKVNTGTDPVAREPVPLVLLAIVLVVFGATLVEGAMNDWATVYMRDAPWGGIAIEGYGLTVFASMITLGRFTGDWINARLGPAHLARLCLLTALAGVSLLVSAQSLWMAFLGFGLAGFGVSTIFPLGISASAGLGKTTEARNVSIMTFGALTGFLIGPPAIGFAAEAITLKLALGLLFPPLVVSVILAGRLEARAPEPD